MDNLTIEQRAKVASEVEKREFVALCLGPNGGGIPYILLKSDPHNIMWKPIFEGWRDWQRSQALALVEYVCINHMEDIRCHEICDAITHKDVAALELLCYRMMEK